MADRGGLNRETSRAQVRMVEDRDWEWMQIAEKTTGDGRNRREGGKRNGGVRKSIEEIWRSAGWMICEGLKRRIDAGKKIVDGKTNSSMLSIRGKQRDWHGNELYWSKGDEIMVVLRGEIDGVIGRR